MNKTIAKTYEKLRLLYGYRFYSYYKILNKKLLNLHNNLFYKYDRCFIIGTGPSLNQTDFTPIKYEVMMGTNNLYKNMEKFDISPELWCVADEIIFKKYGYDLLHLDTLLFLTNGAGQLFLHRRKDYLDSKINEPIVIRPLSDMKSTSEFSTDLIKGANGGMVTLSCLQIAYYLGFKDVYLIGCDCSSKGKHYDSTLNVKNDNDYWEHFFKLYEVCKKVYEKDGRKIFNATVGGNLEVFERVKLSDLK